MKKVLVLMLAVIMILSSFMLVGCDEDKQPDEGKGTTTATTQNSTTATTQGDNGDEQSTTIPSDVEQSTTVADDEQTTTTAVQDDATTTTKKPTNTTKKPTNTTKKPTTTTKKPTTTTKKPTTTTTKPTTTTTTEKVITDSQGVIRKERTEKVYMYSVNEETFEIGTKQERTITYKGTIKIGNTAATTGVYTQVGGAFNDGLKAYINTINFDGGIGGDYGNGVKGYYIEFVHYSDNFDGQYGLKYTKRLVEEDKVFALVGQFGSPTVGATIDYIKQKGVIACSLVSGMGELYNTNATSAKKGSTIFPVMPIYTTEGRIIVGRILQECYKAEKIGIIYTDDEVGLGIRDGAKAQIDALGAGYECVVSEAALSTAGYTSAAQKVADCDVIIVASTQKGTEGILKALIKNGIYRAVFLSYSVANTQTLQSIKGEYDKLPDVCKFPIYANSWISATDVESYLEFCEEVMGYTGENELVANSYAMYGWVAADVFCEGLERVVIEEDKGITTDKFVKAMESDEINLKMSADSHGDTELDYSGGYRLGTTTMSLLKNVNNSCDYFAELYDMKDFIDFIKTGDAKYAK